MKKNCFILLVSCFVAFGFSSCTDADQNYRDENLAFMDNIKNREGVHEIITDSVSTGMYYEVLKTGTGELPIQGNVVSVAYQGWKYNDTINYTAKHPLLETEVFDSSDKFDFRVGGDVIDGWNLAIQKMPVGSKWRVYIPYYLGYGTSGTTNIPSYSTLIFDIYLREIVSEY